ncbi:MAG: transglutaminase domain-containing protein [Bacteroidaceae bacterium]|nr:transglutaminase domain-containing protein [Bacteroidaceae bacterium]
MKRIILIACAAILTMVCHAQSEEESNLLFLYENMSLPDRIDYDSAYYRQQVRLALQARREMPWGTSVPEREFRHFVLPPRVSNEDLDTARAVFFRELKPRLQGLTMSEAVLEVNHWCHEHVTYRPTDARTLSPLATYRTAYGRCGEESVFTVAALRAVGIPARQVYTPRWAHTDDNHAWVEAWADGRWWFLGACEPEPILNMGWFNESASRGMLMHTKVFGNYDGPEEVVNRQYALTEINVIGNYAPARRLTVTVLDSLDHPVPDVAVGFKVYNYAEFFTVAAKLTDAAGQASLTAGHGDMLVWASTPTAYAFAKACFATDSTLTLKLTNPLPTVHSPLPTFHYPLSTDLDITPPSISATLPTVSPAQRAANDRRLAVEDSIRHAYELTMPDPRSRGNHAVIAAFRDSAAARSLRALAATLLSILPDKDLQDITLDVLLDNLPPEPAVAGLAPESAIVGLPGDVTLPYLLSPRIDRERLTAYKAPLRAAFKGASIQQLIAWTRDSITLVTNQNPQHLRIQPLGVYRSRTADAAGRNIFFVAAARAIGIPARINEINGKVQYYDQDWIDVAFDTPVASSPNREVGRALFTYTPVPYTPDPKYYTHFTLSKLTPRNTLQLLTYPWGSTFESTFRNGVTLDAGTYFLTTGIRMADGSVRAHLSAFTIAAGDTTTVPLHLRTATDAVTVIGSLNAEDLYQPLSVNSGHLNSSPDGEAGRELSLLATCGRGYYAIGLIAPNHEPTNHALRDIALVREDFERWGRKLVLLLEDQESASRFNFSEIQGLPSTTVWGTDIDGHIRAEILGQMNLPTASLPIFLICDSFNRVVFVQQGYTIGLGEQMQKVIQQLK